MHNRVDLGFVVDTTGSMGSFLNDAKAKMQKIVEEAVKSADIDARCVLIDYRDHPPEDRSYAANLQTGKAPVTVAQFNSTLQRLGLGSGGDAPESVLDGIHMLADVEWREHSRRLAFLVGDAPAHGYAGQGYGDHWPEGCPCGKTSEAVTADLEDLGITLFGVVVSRDARTIKCFEEFAGYTGGKVLPPASPTEQIKLMLQEEFGNINFDRKILDTVLADPEWDVGNVAKAVGEDPRDVDASIRRLLGRDLIPVPEAA